MRKILFFVNVLAAGCLLVSYASRMVSPAEMAWPGLFGLAYPVFFAANVLFLIFWLIAGPIRGLLSAGVLLIGLTVHLDFFAAGEAKDAGTAETIKLVSYNVRLFDYYNWRGGKETRNRIFDVLKERAPDVVCFQEFYYSEKKGVFETRDTLKSVLGLGYLHDHYSHHLTGHQHFGLATYSRFPIIKKGHIEFESDKNNFATWVDLKMGVDTIRVFNVHMASIRFKKEDYELMEEGTDRPSLDDGKRLAVRLLQAFEKRASQTEQVISVLAESPHPVILAGDFNDTPVSYCYARFTSLLNDAFLSAGTGVGSTYIGRFPSFRIDYVLHSPGLMPLEYRRLPEELSDHHAIEVVLALPER